MSGKEIPDKQLVVNFLRAVLTGDAETVKTLLAAGAPVDIILEIEGSRKRPIHMAAVGGHDCVVTALLAGGADKEGRDENGMTPLHVAANLGRDVVVKTLLTAGVDKEARETKDGLKAVHFAAIGGHQTVITILLHGGADKDALDTNGLTALHYAALGGYTGVAKVLLAAGANSRIHSKDGTPLEIAEQAGHQAIADLLRA